MNAILIDSKRAAVWPTYPPVRRSYLSASFCGSDVKRLEVERVAAVMGETL